MDIDKDWLRERGLELGYGDRQYHDHPDCTDAKKLLVTRREDGSIFGYCMKCGAKLNINNGPCSVDEFQWVRDTHESLPAELPDDMTTDIPIKEAMWFLKAGIPLATARALGWGWSPRLRRVILPIHKDGRLVYYQARATDGREPKYLNPSTGKTEAVPVYYLGSTDDRPRIVVFTEDILSAVRVSAVAPAIPALGTKPGPQHVVAVGPEETPVVWLDGDGAGRGALPSWADAFAWHPLPPRFIFSDKDPKAYTNAEIRQFLTL